MLLNTVIQMAVWATFGHHGLENYAGEMVPFCGVDTVLRHEDHNRRTMIMIFVVNTLVSILLPNNELKNSTLKDLYF